ncbi:hypothetical protein FC52_GL001145 [Lactobacillus pasteurii DSM 23907 = CRBIP 24.76]|nr:garvicin Q family class II bacteriocin [Lactobacillus pasteurii]KRK08027.1 hypothetical protein FC52_GL001145 [Lactobacillus pasteurii DSM 23907 = CRBIP 24.76]
MKDKKKKVWIMISGKMLNKIVVASVSTALFMDMSILPVQAAVSQEAIDQTKISSTLANRLDSYVKIEEGKFVLDIPSNSGLDQTQIDQAKDIIEKANSKLQEENVEVESESLDDSNQDLDNQDQAHSVFGNIFMARSKKKHHKSSSSSMPKYIIPEANGYGYRSKNGKWHYVVTKSPFEAAFGVALHGWESALGGGWISGQENAPAYKNFINGKYR